MVRSTNSVSLAMATNLELAHATASAELSPRLTAAEEVAKFIRTKPVGTAGALIILGMMGLAIASILGPAVQNVVIAISIPVIPRVARVVRSAALSVKEHAYVEAVQALGASRRRVILQHIIPNVMAPYIIMVTAQLGAAILAEAALSYLGLGAAEPTPSWGLMLSGSAPSYAEKAPWIALFPGIAISLGVFGFNLFGDSLRDALDPKLRKG